MPAPGRVELDERVAPAVGHQLAEVLADGSQHGPAVVRQRLRLDERLELAGHEALGEGQEVLDAAGDKCNVLMQNT